MRKSGGFTLVELLIFLSALLIPVFFLIYYSPGITSAVQDYQCKKNLKSISLGLHIYAAQDSEHSFPRADSAEAAFRKIFVNGSIIDPAVFDDPRSSNGKPSGTPGPFLLSPSTDLKGVDFLYAKERLALNSDPSEMIVISNSFGVIPVNKFFALHVGGQVTQEKSPPSSEFVS